MKIVILGGFDRSLYLLRGPLIRDLVRDGHQVIAAAPAENPEVANNVERLGATFVPVRLNRTGVNPLEDIGDFWRLVFFFLRQKPDVVITYTLKPAIYGTLAARCAGVPFRFAMITGMGSTFEASGIFARLCNVLISQLARIALSFCQAIIFHNQYDKDFFHRKTLLRDRGIVVGGSGVDLAAFMPSALPVAPVVFVMIARLIRPKGVVEYAEAGRLVQTSHPKVRFTILGEYDKNPEALGPEELKQLFERCGIEWMGFQEDVRPYLAAASVLVLPSYYREGLPRTILEAMAMGRAVITTAWPGCRDAITHGQTGLLVAPKDVNALAEAMRIYLRQPALLREHGRVARLEAEKRYGSDAINNYMLEAFGLRDQREGPRASPVPQKRPTLLVVTTVAETICAFLIPYVTRLVERGFAVDAMTSNVARLLANPSPFRRVFPMGFSRDMFALSNAASISAVRAVIDRGRYDIVHVHTPIASFIVRFACRRRNAHRPILIYTAHGFHFHSGGRRISNFVYTCLEKLAARWSDYIVVINEEDYVAARRRKFAPPERLRRMPGIGVNLRHFSRHAVPAHAVEDTQRSLPVPKGAKFVLSVGELTPNKRHQDAIRAFAMLKRPDLHLLIAGVGRFEPHLRKLVTDLKVGDRVKLLGFRNDIRELLICSSAFLFVTEREGLPRGLTEAMAMDVFCIATDVRGNRDLLGSLGRPLVPVGDLTAIVGAVEWMLANPKQVSEEVSKYAGMLAEYSEENVWRLHEELYANALASRAQSATTLSKNNPARSRITGDHAVEISAHED